MSALLDVIVPVFLVIGFGYVIAWRGLFSESYVDGLMIFTQKFAIPCLLFRAISTLDLGDNFHLALIFSYYAPALLMFACGIVGARFLFNRPWPDCVAIGFCCLFANAVLLGLPITERAYGAAALAPNYAIIAMNAPICYGVGITVMEIVRAETRAPLTLLRTVLKAVFANALILAIGLGVFVNLTELAVPNAVADALDLMARAALPAALFGLGGVLYRYKPEGDWPTILFVVSLTLLVRPVLTWFTSSALPLEDVEFRSAVLTAAMPAGVNAYVFANMYGVAKRVAASAVLLGTALSVLTIWGWLAILP